MIITFEIDVDTDIIRLHKPHSFGKQFLFCEKNPQKELLYQSTCLHNMVYFIPTFKRIFCCSKEPVCVGKQISWANIDMKREVAWDHVYNFAYNSSHYRVGPMFRTNPILIPTLHRKVIRIDCYSVFQGKIDKSWKRSVCINCSLRDWPVLTIHPSSDTRIPLANPLRKVVVPEPSRGKCRKSHEHYPWLQSWKTSERQKRKVSLICIDYNST